MSPTSGEYFIMHKCFHPAALRLKRAWCFSSKRHPPSQGLSFIFAPTISVIYLSLPDTVSLVLHLFKALRLVFAWWCDREQLLGQCFCLHPIRGRKARERRPNPTHSSAHYDSLLLPPRPYLTLTFVYFYLFCWVHLVLYFYILCIFVDFIICCYSTAVVLTGCTLAQCNKVCISAERIKSIAIWIS